MPILPAPSGIDIAGFNIVGDMELIMASGQYLANKVKTSGIKYDVILTTELKGLPVAQEISRLLGVDYVCLRKNKKCYMLDPVSTRGSSITSGETEYFVSITEINKLKSKNVLFVDDVISTGSTLGSIFEFAKNQGFTITAGLGVLREGMAGLDDDIEFELYNTKVICAGFLPLPNKNN